MCCTRTSVWVHWNIALDVPICVAVYFLSIATFSISCLQDKIFFLTDQKIFFWNSEYVQGFIQPFHSFPPRHMRPFLPPRRIVSIRQTFVFFCLMSWQYHQSNESLMTAGNPYTFQFNGRDSVTKDVTKRSVGNIYLYQDTNDRPATC